MKAYFAGQCGAVLGSIAGVGVAIAMDKMEGKPATESIMEFEDRQHRQTNRAIICIAAGSAIGGLAGILMASK